MKSALIRWLILLAATSLLFALSIAWLGYDFTHLGDRLTTGTSNDPRHTEWLIEQTIENILVRPTELGYAGIFFGEPDTLGYTSANYGFAFMGLPVYLLSGHNPTLTYNFLQWFGVLLTASSAYLLITYLLQPRFSVALLASLMIAFAADRVLRMGQIEHTWYFLILFMLYFTHRLIDQPRLRWAALLALIIVSAVLINGYMLLIGGIAMALIVGYALIVKRVFSIRLIALFLLAGVAGIAVTYPFINFRFERQAVVGQGLQAQIQFSAQPQDWVTGMTALYRTQPIVNDELPLFVGFIPLGLALLALVWRKRGGELAAKRTFTRRDVVNAYALLILAGYLLSLGPVLRINDQVIADTPYQLLLKLPGFNAIRLIARYIWLPIIGTAVLSAFALDVLLNRLPSRRGQIVLIGASALLVLELLPYTGRGEPDVLGAYRLLESPLRLGNSNTVPDFPVYAWLRSLPPETPVLHYPMRVRSDGLHIGGYKWHHQPMLNGYASYFPQWYTEMAWDDFPTAAHLVFLNQRGIRYVLVYNQMLTSSDGDRIHEALEMLGFPYVDTFGDVDVYGVPAVPRPQADPSGVVRVDFDAPVYYGEGWSTSQGDNGDATYQWTGDTSATLELPFAFTGNGVLSFRTLAAISPDVLASLSVYVNDQPVTVYVSEDGIFSGEIPADVLSSGGEQILIRFETGTVLPASTLYENGDDRLLGIAFDWVELAPAGGIQEPA
jgi:hypothetical protein